MITLKLKLRAPSKCKLNRLTEYTDEFVGCVQWFLDKIDAARTTSRTKLHKLYYAEARHLFNLPSANIQVASDKAIEAYRSYLRKDGNKSKPKIKSRFACFRNDTIKLNNNALRLTLNGQRIWLPFNVPDKFKKYLEYPIARSEVREVKGKWYLYLTVKEPTPEVKAVSDVLGIDLGLAKIAVASNIEGSINIFFRGDEARAKRQYFEQKADELKHRKDTKQAKGAWRVLKRLSGKEHRWIIDLNHKISRTIVDLAKRTDSAIALENLKGIRHRIKGVKKTNRMLHKWPFRQLRFFIEYKAKQAGVPVVPVEPRKTSSVCSRCGAYSWSRKHQPQFKCKMCGFELNRDLNAARNISLLGRQVLLGTGLLTGPDAVYRNPQVPIGNPLA